jgi:hypothetical protein
LASSNSTNKIIAMLGLAAVVFVGVTWFLPKIEKHKAVVGVHPAAAVVGPSPHTVATGPAAVDQSMGGLRDFNLSGLAIEKDTFLSGF